MNSETLTLLLSDIAEQLKRSVSVWCSDRIDYGCITRFIIAVREQVLRINNSRLYPHMLFLSEQTIAILDGWVRAPYKLVDVRSDRALAQITVDSTATRVYMSSTGEVRLLLMPSVSYAVLDAGRGAGGRKTLADFLP